GFRPSCAIALLCEGREELLELSDGCSLVRGRFDRDENGVVSGERAYDLGNLGAVDHHRYRLRLSHFGFCDDEVIAGYIEADPGYLGAHGRARKRVEPVQFHETHFLDVSRDARLCCSDAVTCELARELLLSRDISTRDYPSDLILPLFLHPYLCPNSLLNPHCIIIQLRLHNYAEVLDARQ